MDSPKHKEKQDQALLGGGTTRHQTQQKQGKCSARERIQLLTDPNSFHEIDLLAKSLHTPESPYTDGVITGFATIDGRQVALYAQDFTIMGGSLGNRHAQKISKIMDMAAKTGCPIIGILDSGGARIQEGIHALAGYGQIFSRNVKLSGVVPQISIVLGPCAGGAVYSPALTDIIFAVNGISNLFVTGPSVIEQVLHQSISKEELGGTAAHSQKSGVLHHISPDEQTCFEAVRSCLSYLPDNYKSFPTPLSSQSPSDHDWNVIVPHNTQQAYDVKKVIAAICDGESFFELQESYAPNIVTGFARIEGQSVGMVANQALVKAGCLDINASCKAARFINMCDNFNIPIVSLVDVPGFLPGVDQEHDGIIRHGAKLLYAYAHATVPKISIILRKSFGGAYIVMGSKHLGADLVYAYPFAQIAVMGASGATAIVHRRELAKIDDQATLARERRQLEARYEQDYLHPYVAAEAGYIDAIIEPNNSRQTIITALAISQNKVERHIAPEKNNIPL